MCKPFRSQFSAQFWYELRANGWALPGATALIWVGGIALRWLMAPNDSSPQATADGTARVLDPLWSCEIIPSLAIVAAAVVTSITARRRGKSKGRPTDFLLRLPAIPVDKVRAEQLACAVPLAGTFGGRRRCKRRRVPQRRSRPHPKTDARGECGRRNDVEGIRFHHGRRTPTFRPGRLVSGVWTVGFEAHEVESRNSSSPSRWMLWDSHLAGFLGMKRRHTHRFLVELVLIYPGNRDRRNVVESSWAGLVFRGGLCCPVFSFG